MQIPRYISLSIPHELSGHVVSCYSENGKHITPETAELRELAHQKRIAKLQRQIAECSPKQKRLKGKLLASLHELEQMKSWLGNKTNKMRKLIGMFIVLKSISTSGVIKNYSAQATYLEAITKKNFRTIRNYIDELETLNLVTVTRFKKSRANSITLAGWETLCNLFGIEYANEFTRFKYDTQNPKQSPDYVLDGAEEAEKQEQLYFKLKRKIQANQTVLEFLKNHYNIVVINRKSIEQINQLRHSWFVDGFPQRSCEDPEFKYCCDFLYQLNTCVNRTRKTIKLNRNMLQLRRITYLKRNLAERGITNVSNTILKSNTTMRVPNRKLQQNGYDHITRSATWYLPSSIDTQLFAVKVA